MELSKPYLGIHIIILKIKDISRRKKKCHGIYGSQAHYTLFWVSIFCIQEQNQCWLKWKHLAATRMACGKHQIVAYLPLIAFPEILGKIATVVPKVQYIPIPFFVSKCNLKSIFAVFQIWNSFLQPDSLEQCPLLWKYYHVWICLLSEVPRIILPWVLL